MLVEGGGKKAGAIWENGRANLNEVQGSERKKDLYFIEEFMVCEQKLMNFSSILEE